MLCRCAKSFLCLLALVLLAVPALAQGPPSDVPVRRGAEMVDVVTPIPVNVDLRSLPLAPGWRPGDPIKEIPRRHFGREDRESPTARFTGPDPLLGLQAAAPQQMSRAFQAPDINIAGQGFSGVSPPDTVGEVGQNFYVQAINDGAGTTIVLYNKADGSVAAGPITLDTLGSGFCGNGFGDPIVLWDHLAERWLWSEFSSQGNRMCVYISQTDDPINGGFFFYEFQAPSFPDYPKFAVWPDAYYVTTNETSGPAIYALERSQMLVGGAATFQRLVAPEISGFGFQALTPGDLDGPPAAAGTPQFLIRHRDDEAHDSNPDPSQDFLDLFELSVDFANSANTTLTGPIAIPIAEIDSEICGFTSFSCVPQPNSNTELDPLREVVMWRSQFRSFGSHDAMIGSLVTDVDGTDHTGVRWYELRRTGGGPWSVFQEGTLAPDADNRFMSSAAMDSSGNIAVGYNVSSSSTFPSLRYAGRFSSDPAGTLPQGENNLVDGTASNSSNRYGDYASLNVDPIDDCTFWFTGEYNPSTAWATRIGRFVFEGCGGTCGNNVREGTEVCDGTDLGGETCSSQGCTGGGTLACASDCRSFDNSGCSDCPICDNDGVCEAGEDCNGCPGDCVGGTSSGAVCGNGVCEAGDGEDCVSCPSDCNGQQGGKPSGRFCCGDGDGTNPLPCSDPACSSGGFSCTDTPQLPGSFCCGDAVCDGGESCGNCALDCTLGAEACTGGVDEDCDGLVDCDDTGDCAGDLACVCGGRGSACTSGTDCCSGVCKNNGTCR